MVQTQSAANTLQTEELGGFSIVGISTLTCNENGKAADDINALWQRFFEEAVGDSIPHKDGQAIYAVYSDYEGDHTKPYRVTIGCKTLPVAADLREGLHKIHIPAADYMIFAARGEQPKSLLQTWETIWKSDIKRSYGCDLEIYGQRFFEEGLHEILVCVGVKL
ncbi:MAG: GyrI-like domain-containing protein [Micavibrio sp.]